MLSMARRRIAINVTGQAWTNIEYFTAALAKAAIGKLMAHQPVVSTAEAAIDAAVAGVGLTRVLSYQSDCLLLCSTPSGYLLNLYQKAAPPPGHTSDEMAALNANSSGLISVRVQIDAA